MKYALTSLILLFSGTGAGHAQTPPPAQAPVVGPVHAQPFPDVPKDHWAYQAVEAVRKAGIVQGYPARAAKSRPSHRAGSVPQLAGGIAR